MTEPTQPHQEVPDGHRQTGPLALRVAAWKAHAATPAHRRKVDAARRIVADTLARGLAVSVSGGKDSIGLLGVVRDVDPAARAVFVDDGLQTRHTYAVLRSLRGLDWIHSDMPLEQMLKVAGYWGYRGPLCEWRDWTTREWRDTLMFAPLRRYLAEHGLAGTYVGLRADESRGRRMRAAVHGADHWLLGERMYSVCPILPWTGLDSLAAAAARDLPISQVYLTAVDPERERTSAALAGTAATTWGRFERLAEVDPELYRRLCADFPKMRTP